MQLFGKGPQTHDAVSDRTIVACPECRKRVRMPSERIGILTCPNCFKCSTVSTVGRQLPAIGLVSLFAVPWILLAVALRGRPGSAVIIALLTFGCWFGLRQLSLSMREAPIAKSVLREGTALFVMMSIVSGLFAGLSIALSWWAHSSLQYLPIAQLLRLLARVSDPQVEELFLLLGRVAGVLLAGLALLAWLRERTSAAESIGKVRTGTRRFLTIVGATIAAAMSFSIVGATSGASVVVETKDRLSAEYRRLAEALEKLETSIAVLFGERIVEAFLQEQAARTFEITRSQGTTCGSDSRDHPCDLEALTRATLELEQRAPGPYPTATATPRMDTGSANVTELIARYQSEVARRVSEAKVVTESQYIKPSTYDRMTVDGVAKFAAEACRVARCNLNFSSPRTLREVLTLMVEVAMTVGGVPSLDLKNELGAFAQALVDAITKNPAKDSLKSAIVDKLVEWLSSRELPPNATVVLPEEVAKSIRTASAVSSAAVARDLLTRRDAAQQATARALAPKGSPDRLDSSLNKGKAPLVGTGQAPCRRLTGAMAKMAFPDGDVYTGPFFDCLPLAGPATYQSAKGGVTYSGSATAADGIRGVRFVGWDASQRELAVFIVLNDNRAGAVARSASPAR